ILVGRLEILQNLKATLPELKRGRKIGDRVIASKNPAGKSQRNQLIRIHIISLTQGQKRLHLIDVLQRKLLRNYTAPSGNFRTKIGIDLRFEFRKTDPHLLNLISTFA